MHSPETRPTRPHHVVVAVLLGLHFILQLLLILPIALVVFPLVLVTGFGHHTHEWGVRGPFEPPGNQSTRRKP